MRGAGERQVYVPRGRRLMNEQKQKEDEANNLRLREEKEQEQQERQARLAVESAVQAEARTETETLIKEMTLEKKAETKKKETNGNGGPQQRQIYVPPGRRLAQQQLEQEKASKGRDEDRSDSPLAVRRDMKAWTTDREREREREREASSTQVASSSSSSSAPVPAYKHFIDDDRLASRVLMLLDLPSDLSESRRSALTQPYLENSALCRWLGPTDCMIVFASESTCQRVCAQQSSSRSAMNGSVLYAPIAIAATKFCTRDYLQTARELYDAIPATERDSRVANRMIGAALGIRVVPRSTTSSGGTKSAASAYPSNGNGSVDTSDSAGLNSSKSAAKKRRVDEPVLSDAWDD